ncbi:type IV pilin protein [Clostridium cellulovorans]|uniref:Uncharacterized protein n=1 Tax=Clostridium cellulovorans (strain ATCC 35296 / DSM 3052 / OCM 3 / 743B) TaxID=573061 RepID=D9SSZ3_CLOC7|nr:type II secretion system protein [Clostridium cellulovorans]ADL52655.1 hypothetical protein Clocel_2963 [Clostridium cellulovorans 743B]
MQGKTGKERKGFTLIELIIVLAVMAIIASIAIPNFVSVRDNSKRKADAQSCETIKRMMISEVVEGSINDGDTFTYLPSGPTLTDTNNTLSTNTEALLAKELKDVKKPQFKNPIEDTNGDGEYTEVTGAGVSAPTVYTIIISSGNVQVKTS